MKTQFSNTIMYAFYGILAIASVAFAVINPKAVFIAIGAGLFCFVGIYSIVKTFKRKRP